MPGAFGSLDGGIACHQSHAAGITAQIDGREICIPGDHANVERINSQHFSDNVRQDRIGPLADFRRPAKHAHTATAIQFQLDAGVRQFVVVDRSLSARHIRAAGDSNSFAVRQLPEFVLPPRARHHFIDALAQR